MTETAKILPSRNENMDFIVNIAMIIVSVLLHRTCISTDDYAERKEKEVLEKKR